MSMSMSCSWESSGSGLDHQNTCSVCVCALMVRSGVENIDHFGGVVCVNGREKPMESVAASESENCCAFLISYKLQLDPGRNPSTKVLCKL